MPSPDRRYRVDIVRDGQRRELYGDASSALEAIHLIATGLAECDHVEIWVEGSPYSEMAALTSDRFVLAGYGGVGETELEWVEVLGCDHIPRRPIETLFLI